MRILFVLLCCVLAASASAQVYKWTDSSGKTHYGDKAPDDSNAQQVKIDVRSYDGPVEVKDWGAIIRKRSMPAPAKPKGKGEAKNITMYSTSWCPHCKRAKLYFAQNNIAYEDIDVEASEQNKREFKALGGGGVPLILVGDKAMRGFDPKKMDALLRN